MCWKKKKESIKETITPIFPVYLDTMRIKDTLATLKDGLTSLYSVTQDISNKLENDNSTTASINLYKVSFDAKISENKFISDKHREQYERVHTDTSLFYKVLHELKQNNKIKKINNSEDIKDVKEGNIVLVEGIVAKNDITDFVNSLMYIVDKIDINSISKELKQNKEILNNSSEKDDRESNIKYMICNFDGNEIYFFLNSQYLIGDSGIELYNGKFKILGVVFKKVNENEKISLVGDSPLGYLKQEYIKTIFENANNITSNFFNIPKVKYQLDGPTFGIIPIAIYL